ncbi:protein tyrosine phosphatase family protein [Ancylothrix sp. C2]|uniref:protein tyrosine phosphatase family protein n=1 Tax=Ancylothrix sp. D3o TaxID=2953691 RepID=UPI0021BB460C|nr:protein tyrosine phosphatase family protein [Ancylothrix sp. D3o]MCT7952109.1 protein tyrosine phosphatase family protein [Ancylothrix sp. D3o]
MENLIKINDELAIVTNQITAEQLQQAALEGYQSVMNLRAIEEEDFVTEEPLQVKAAGLQYFHIPIKPGTLTKELTDAVLKHIEEAPKPVIIHCKSGMRSGAMALMSIATKQDLTAEETLQKAEKIGLNYDNNPQMKEFLMQYIGK